MKKLIYLMASSVLLAACDQKEEPINPSVSEGTEVDFLVGSVQSRTTYSEADWEDDNATSQEIFWGNYLDQIGTDQIRVFCPEAADGRQIATYNVNAAAGGSSVAESVQKTADYGVQWGAEGTPHTFYSFYPAEKCGSTIDNGKITATVTAGQAPVNYKVIRGTNTVTKDAVQWLGNNPGTATATDVTTVYGQPDMSAAVMAAKTTVSVTEYGKPVSLNFNVLADVLDLTINGPKTKNTLNGTGKPARDYIRIQSVTITSTKDISGSFTLDLSDYSTNGTNPSGYVATVTNGNKSILLQTAQVTDGGTYYPTLRVRSNENATVDKLRLRAFLLPGQIQNLDELTVTIGTDVGDYEMTLGSQNMVSGQIHRVKFPVFYTHGNPFDFGSWMAQLDPNIYVSELSYPGAWNAYSSNYQSLSITEQYTAGVRAFQLNVTSNTRDYTSLIGGNRYYANPYITDQPDISLSEALTDIAGFMTNHTNEFIFIIISRKDRSNSVAADDTPVAWYNKVTAVLKGLTQVYNKGVNKETTIEDVKGHLVVILDYDGATNETSPALILPWQNVFATSATASITPIYWGTTTNEAMQMCITQADNVGSFGNPQASQATREAAINDFVKKSLEMYQKGEHDCLFQLGIGGYLNGNKNNATSAKQLANIFNPYVNSILANPNRQACPMGIVLMNFAGDASANGVEIISTIVNNNRSFTLAKKGGNTPTAVQDKTNSSFKPGSGNAVK